VRRSVVLFIAIYADDAIMCLTISHVCLAGIGRWHFVGVWEGGEGGGDVICKVSV
jgi:hypothetical protein